MKRIQIINRNNNEIVDEWSDSSPFGSTEFEASGHRVQVIRRTPNSEKRYLLADTDAVEIYDEPGGCLDLVLMFMILFIIMAVCGYLVSG